MFSFGWISWSRIVSPEVSTFSSIYRQEKWSWRGPSENEGDSGLSESKSVPTLLPSVFLANSFFLLTLSLFPLSIFLCTWLSYPNCTLVEFQKIGRRLILRSCYMYLQLSPELFQRKEWQKHRNCSVSPRAWRWGAAISLVVSRILLVSLVSSLALCGRREAFLLIHFLSGSSESTEESPTGPLAMVGCWDQRKTQGTFHTSIKTSALPLFIWPSIPSLAEALLPQSQPQPCPHILPRTNGLLETTVPVSTLLDSHLRCCLWPSSTDTLLSSLRWHPSHLLGHAWDGSSAMACGTLDLLCVVTSDRPGCESQVSHLLPVGSHTTPQPLWSRSFCAYFLMRKPGWREPAPWVRAANSLWLLVSIILGKLWHK